MVSRNSDNSSTQTNDSRDHLAFEGAAIPPELLAEAMQAKARVRARIEEVAARIADAERARVEGEVDSEAPVDGEVIAVFD